RAPTTSPLVVRAFAILACDTATSRRQPALPGSARDRSSAILRPSRKALSAAARSPWATSTSPTLLNDTDRSRRQPALPGSAREVALGDQHVADLVERHRQVAPP